MPGILACVRRPVPTLFALLFLVEVVNWAIVPLAPRFADELELSTVQTGAVLAATSIVSVLVCIPAGVLTDRLGPRAITLGCALLATVGSAGQALAVDFWSLLGARALFGAGFAIAWTAGLVWLGAEVGAGRRARALGSTVTTAGVGGLVGPALAGLLAEHVGLPVPFVLTATLLAAVTITLALATVSSGGGAAEHEPLRLASTMRRARRDRVVLGGLAAGTLGGLTTGIVGLLVPLQLDANGLSEGEIGVVFSVGASLFVVASALVARGGDRLVQVRTVAIAAVALAAALLLVLASKATAVVAAFVLLRAPVLSTLFTVSFPLAASGARRAEVGEGAVLGLLNVLWGVASTVGPLAGGAVAQAVGYGAAYGVVFAVAVVVAGWAFAAARAEQHAEAQSLSTAARQSS